MKKKLVTLLCLLTVLAFSSANAVVMGGWNSQFGYRGNSAYFECYNTAWAGQPKDFTIVVKQYTKDPTGRITEYMARDITYKWSDLQKRYLITWKLPRPVTEVNTGIQIGCWINGKLVYFTQWLINNGQVSLFKSSQ